MNTLTIALLQLAQGGHDLAANQARGEAACREARAMGADLALFPEMWSTGYSALIERAENAPNVWRAPHRWSAAEAAAFTCPDPVGMWGDLPIGRDHPFIRHFQGLARELQMAIALTYLERWDGAPRNSVSIIDRRGALCLTYAKVHTCAFSPNEAALTPGDEFPACTLDTGQGPVKIGAMICYDREFPESARILMLNGAEIILTPNACDLEVNRLAQFRSRALENMVGVAMANYAGRGWGHSVAFDPIGFDATGRSRDTLIVEAGETEGIYLARFDLAALRDYRERETWGNAFRRPDCYQALVAPDVTDPFVRVDAQGRRFGRR